MTTHVQISKEEYLNPIKQDIKKGKLRFVRNCFPHKGYIWNYGAFPQVRSYFYPAFNSVSLPTPQNNTLLYAAIATTLAVHFPNYAHHIINLPAQTWEDPNATHPETKAKGDNDPLDVCEIGELVAAPGSIIQVKVLGVMALLDEGETDWKIMTINVNDPLAPKLNDVEDVERHLPGLLRATNEWFRIYKIPDGKPENQFAFSGECKNKKYAMDIVRECAEAWERLITGKTQPGDVSLANGTVGHSPARQDPQTLASKIPRGEHKAPEPIDASIDKVSLILDRYKRL